MLIPTIHFSGACDEAITFYKEVLGATVKEVAYARHAPPDSGLNELPPNFVMHSELTIFDTPVYMTDGSEKQVSSENFSFTIHFDTKEEVTSAFNKLADGGRIIEALAPQFWVSLYGFVEDKFGVGWQFSTRS
jgi:PhnB protein